MKHTVLLAAIGLFLAPVLSHAQSYAFGLKGGPSLGFQRWGEGQRNVLYAYHLAGFIESAPEDGSGIIYAQAGYHVRGSALRVQAFSLNGNFFNQRTDEFRFYNVSAQIGFKNRIRQVSNSLYYFFGVRGEYTIDDNLDEYQQFTNAGIYYPTPQSVRKFNYGISIGGGWEFPFGDLISGIVEVSLHPDFSRQYDQPSVPNIFDPFIGITRTIPERRAINTTAEISLGLRFLRKITYID